VVVAVVVELVEPAAVETAARVKETETQARQIQVAVAVGPLQSARSAVLAGMAVQVLWFLPYQNRPLFLFLAG
jgi:hypothetical protein